MSSSTDFPRLLNFWVLIIVFLVIFSGCTPKLFTPEEHDMDYLAFGNGGGFSGKVTTYYLSRRGKVYQRNSIAGEAKFIGNLSTEIYQQIISNIEITDLVDKELDQPGNIYRFLEWRNEGIQYRWVWSAADQLPAAELIYKNLNQLLKNDVK